MLRLLLTAVLLAGSSACGADIVPVGNLTVGAQSLSPMVSYQYTTEQRGALGIQTLLVDYPAPSGSLRGWGALLTFQAFLEEAYRGPFVHGGAGLFALRARDAAGIEESVTSPAFTLAVGWRLRRASGFNVGIAAGALAMPLRPQTIMPGVAAILPTLLIDIGFTM